MEWYEAVLWGLGVAGLLVVVAALLVGAAVAVADRWWSR